MNREFVIGLFAGIIVAYFLAPVVFPARRGMFNLEECQKAHTQYCNEWKSLGYREIMHVRVYCWHGIIPSGCGCEGLKDGYYDKNLNVTSGQWWHCIIPECEPNYGIKIYNKSDCE
jgi:hypothetical protein